MKLSFTSEQINLSPKKMLRQSYGMVGTIPAASLPASTTGFFGIFGNSAYLPFQTSIKPDSATGFITEVNGSDSLTSNGYTITAQQYSYARVNRSRLRVSCIPSSSADQVLLCCFAVSSISASASPYSYTQAKAQLGFHEAVCYAGNYLDGNTIECEMRSHRVLGLTEAQWRDQPPVTVTASEPVPLQWYWIVQYFTMGGLTNLNVIQFKIEVASETEFSGPVQMRG
jgi:hypothetical protein